jgi:8-oxo-dGTP diphosphatase
MRSILHYTASAIVLDDDRVLLIQHRTLGLWLNPGGHIEPDESPARAAVRAVLEETGIQAEVIGDRTFAHPAVTVHPAPFAVLEMDVVDHTVGAHRHIDMVYVCRPAVGALQPDLDEITGCAWVPTSEIAAVRTPPELPDLVAAASRRATRQPAFA